MGRVYGSLNNRFAEGKNYTGRDIQVGDDVTMYYWSDRCCYYVTKVIDQKHIFVKEYEICADKSKVCGIGHQDWLYFKTKKEYSDYLTGWYTRHPKDLYDKNLMPDPNPTEDEPEEWVFRYNHWNRKTEHGGYVKLEPISFGVKDYYYDWEF